MTIRLLLADDHQIVLKGISFFLGLQPDFEIVGEARNGQEVVEMTGSLRPDMVLMDLNMPIMDGIEASRRIAESYPDTKVLVLTSFSDRSHIVPALRTGAIGYMLKEVAPEQLVEAIRSAYKGNVQLHPDIASALLAQLSPHASEQALPSSKEALELLTPRELEVLVQLTKGLSNKEIAQALVVAEKTVKTHVSSILSKLNLADRTQAALYAVQVLPSGAEQG
ncbi:response regulator [Cohnella boryungensis]|uniref:Response regulator n=1 Tax=Cohnella boryungensis TaxID=768479 RepID=A0ABV8SL95_9BACL